MEIISIDESPFYELECEIVTLRREREISHVPCFHAQVDGLPEGMDALIATSDLQGLEPLHKASGEPRLLGQVLADELEVLSELGEVPPLDRVGVILAGDLFARPGLDRRGGSGDVRPVWLALARRCRWVAGVAGNHDLFGPKPSVPDFQDFSRSPGVYFLDGDLVALDGLRIGGLSGVVGRPIRPWRRSEQAFLHATELLLRDAPDLLVMHDGPDVPALGLRGLAGVRTLLETHGGKLLLIRGHAHWETALVHVARNVQVLNVDSRIVVLIRRQG